MDFRETIKRIRNYTNQGDLRKALNFTRYAEDAAETEEDMVEVNEIRHQLRDELGLVASEDTDSEVLESRTSEDE